LDTGSRLYTYVLNACAGTKYVFKFAKAHHSLQLLYISLKVTIGNKTQFSECTASTLNKNYNFASYNHQVWLRFV